VKLLVQVSRSAESSSVVLTGVALDACMRSRGSRRPRLPNEVPMVGLDVTLCDGRQVIVCLGARD